MEDNKMDHHINVELNEEVAEGTYSNLAIITHSPSEFVIDFVLVMPGMPKAPVKSRIILTPEHAQRLMFALQDNIDRFEAIHGPVRQDEEPGIPNIPVNFGGPTGQA
ncbi:MAG: DUF3467 domain-containing protein [Breznakibacter sp.]